MPSTCQLDSHPGQAWDTSHTAYDNGRNDGFVTGSGPVAMGYWDSDRHPLLLRPRQDVPGCRSLVLFGARADVSEPAVPDGGHRGRDRQRRAPHRSVAPTPPNGTIFDRLSAHNITWKNYYSDLPADRSSSTVWQKNPRHLAKASQFMNDAAAGKLPSVSFVDPNFGHQSEEDPQDIRQGERFAAAIINAVMHGKAWAKTLLVWTVRRARRLLRPRRAAGGDQARQHRAREPCRPTFPGRIRPLRIPRSCGDRVAVRVRELRLARRARPHVDLEAHRDEVELARDDVPRRERRQPARLARLQVEARVPEAAEVAAAGLPRRSSLDPTASTTDDCTEGNPGGTIPPPESIVPANVIAGLRIGAT